MQMKPNENLRRRKVQVSIDEVFDHFQQLDVDASGKVSKRELERFLAGDDIQHTFIVFFETADTGITWEDGGNGSVGAVLQLSVAMLPDCCLVSGRNCCY